MKKNVFYGIISMITGFGLFFLTGVTIAGLWWLLGVPFLLFAIFCFLYDRVCLFIGMTREQRAEAMNTMHDNLNRRLEKDRQAREEALRRK